MGTNGEDTCGRGNSAIVKEGSMEAEMFPLKVGLGKMIIHT